MLSVRLLNSYFGFKYYKVEKCFVVMFGNEDFLFKFIFEKKVYFRLLIFLLIFISFYFLDIKVFSYFENFFNFENFFTCIRNYKYLILFIFVSITLGFFFWIKKPKVLIVLWLKKFIYKRLNFIFNLMLFLKATNMTVLQYIEYNIVFILILFVLLIKFIVDIFMDRNVEPIKIIQFLSIPYIFWLMHIIIFIISPKKFKYYYMYFLNLDDIYYIYNIEFR